MLAYAPHRRDAGAGQNSRKTLLLVVVGHAALVAVALTTKMTVDMIRDQEPTVMRNYPIDPPPPVTDIKPDKPTPHTQSRIDRVKPVISTDTRDDPVIVDTGPSIPTGTEVGELIRPYVPETIAPPHVPVEIGAVLRTSEADLRPLYPTDKIRTGEEATLKLRLTIDNKGRVIAVDPVGKADPSFLAAARRHLMRSWRYKPATVDGVATTTTTVISLSFRLEDA